MKHPKTVQDVFDDFMLLKPGEQKQLAKLIQEAMAAEEPEGIGPPPLPEGPGKPPVGP